jgi:replication factor A1
MQTGDFFLIKRFPDPLSGSSMLNNAVRRPDIHMNVRDLRDGMRRVDSEGEIVEISEPRTVNLRTGGEARVADCMLKDDSGQIKLSLWDDQIDMVKQGSKVRVTNGYTNSFRGELRLNVGKYGRLEILQA